MNFDLNDTISYKEYFQKLARQNKLLGEEQFLFGDIDSAQYESITWEGSKLWVWPSERARFSPEADNYFLKREGSLYVSTPQPELLDDRELAYAQCEKTIKQILSRIINDYTGNLLSTQINAYTINRQIMTIGATTFIGCELLINWDDPDGLEYNEDDWNLDD